MVEKEVKEKRKRFLSTIAEAFALCIDVHGYSLLLFFLFFLNIFIRSLGCNVEINRCQIGNFPFMKRLEGIMKAARYRD